MVRTAIQLYTMRSLGESLPELIDRVAGTAFDGVEFAGLGDAGPEEIADVLDATGTSVAGAHVGIDYLEGDPEGTVATYAELGCGMLVVPYLGPASFESEAAVGDAARRLNVVAGDLATHDVGLCYHNHDHEFVPLGGKTAFDRLVESLDDRLGIELDVGWARAAGHDPVALLDRLEDRVPLVHLKDVDEEGSPVELGDGVVDLAACVGAAHDAGAEWLVYEHDDPADPLDSLAHGAATLAALRERSRP